MKYIKVSEVHTSITKAIIIYITNITWLYRTPCLGTMNTFSLLLKHIRRNKYHYKNGYLMPKNCCVKMYYSSYSNYRPWLFHKKLLMMTTITKSCMYCIKDWFGYPSIIVITFVHKKPSYKSKSSYKSKNLLPFLPVHLKHRLPLSLPPYFLCICIKYTILRLFLVVLYYLMGWVKCW